VLRYKDGSSIESPMNADKTEDEDMGVVIGLAASMLVLRNRFLIIAVDRAGYHSLLERLQLQGSNVECPSL
jgi:hypothetical protein